MRIRSPSYPSINLQQAIEMADKIFRVSRQNVITREAAAKDIGYSGITGQSSKMLADMGHFGLIEKAGKGDLRVTDTAVRILHPRNAEERALALNEAAYSPDLYAEIKKHWPDGFVSENSLRGYLMREGFSSGAVGPALSSFFETYRFLQQERAIESHRLTESQEPKQPDNGLAALQSAEDRGGTYPQIESASRPTPSGEQRSEGVKLMAGERVVFVEEAGPAQYLKVIASGDFDETMLEALEDYIKRQKKRLKAPAQMQENDAN